ncbi:MAG: HPF/RaiA family ribosome-associated protein [Bdellovibrionaceae bacterium]|nr:HPF/RaiA family ribosome-associated protein [Pseudobdellovibrionaceae bacterium]NUM59514.1 HPF/RaiA family ribosome-associated protein [Pseudobdellovibrionaceae bacterium]
MNINIHFNNIGKSEAVSDFIWERLDTTFNKFHVENPEVEVFLNIIRARTDFRQPLFSCEILVRTEFNKTVSKIIKKEEDLYKAIQGCVKAMGGAIAKHSTIKNDHHRFERRSLSY